MEYAMLQIFNHPNSSLHEMGQAHLEAPERISLIMDAINNSTLKHKISTASVAQDRQILAVHSDDHLALLQRSSGKARMDFSPDTWSNPYTFDAAFSSAGAALDMAKSAKSTHSFGLVRPPGHHAHRQKIHGFCFLNNIAIAAQSLIDSGLSRVAIIDIDQHHGDGTQSIFYDRDDVLYASLHADPQISFPGTGYCAECGEGQGIGKTVNVPLPYKAEDHDYLMAFDEIISPIVEQYQPEAILVSLGLDGLQNDPYGHLSLSPDLYYEVGKRIDALSKSTGRKVGVMLEGGYHFSKIGIAVVQFFHGLLGNDNPSGKEIIPELSLKFKYMIGQIKATHRTHWIGL